MCHLCGVFFHITLLFSCILSCHKHHHTQEGLVWDHLGCVSVEVGFREGELSNPAIALANEVYGVGSVTMKISAFWKGSQRWKLVKETSLHGVVWAVLEDSGFACQSFIWNLLWALSHHLLCSRGSSLSPQKRFPAFAIPIPPSSTGESRRVLLSWKRSVTDECQLADAFLARVGVKGSASCGVGAFAKLCALLVPHTFNFDPKHTGTFLCVCTKNMCRNWGAFAFELFCWGFFCTATLGQGPF